MNPRTLSGLAFLGASQLSVTDCAELFDDATSVAAVVERVQTLVRAWRRISRVHPSWAPMAINSREDVEHWARRLSSWPLATERDPALAAMAAVMRSAAERVKELVPRRSIGS